MNNPKHRLQLLAHMKLYLPPSAYQTVLLHPERGLYCSPITNAFNWYEEHQVKIPDFLREQYKHLRHPGGVCRVTRKSTPINAWTVARCNLHPLPSHL